jgi:hypothetical protein
VRGPRQGRHARSRQGGAAYGRVHTGGRGPCRVPGGRTGEAAAGVAGEGGRALAGGGREGEMEEREGAYHELDKWH